jgi:hypothetical protein
MMPSSSKKQHNFMEAIAHNKAFAKKVGVPQSVGQDFSKADKGKTFKKGGEMKSDSKEDMKMDVSQDKKMIKKAFGMHDKQEHKGEHTNLSKLKKGGNVKKMATGGMPDPRMAAMIAKKRAMAAGQMMGQQAPAMARPMAPTAAPAPTMPMKKGGKVKKMAFGGMTNMHKMLDGKMMKDSAMKKMAEGGMTMVEKGGKMVPDFAADGKGKMNMGGMTKKMASGGMTSMGKVKTNSGNINGVAERGLTKGKMIKMAGGGTGKKYC